MGPFTHFVFASLLATEALALPNFFPGLSESASPPWGKGYIDPAHHQTSGGQDHGKPVVTTSSAAPVASASSASSATGHTSGGESYIVLFKNGAAASGSDVSAQDTVSTASADDILSQIGLTSDHPDVHSTFDNTGFRGFAASLQSHCLDQLANMSDVAVVEKVLPVSTHGTTSRSGGPWGLQRISSTDGVSGDPSALDFTYSYANPALGSGVDVYIVDTGINTEHVAFGGRATMGWSYDESDTTDGDGHGTHVTGTATGTTFGVASSANIIGVKVLNDQGSGQSSDTVNGINYVIGRHNQRKTEPGFVGSVMSMSWGLTQSSTVIDNVIRAAVAAGIHSAVAAGNSGEDSCSFSPSSSGGSNGPAISVGSIGSGNVISSFSNTGTCNDIYAPGENVISAWIGGPYVINTLDGTSMATPHVTGVIAYTMVTQPQLAQDPAAMKSYLLGSALQNQVSGNANSGDAKLLLNNGVTGAPSKSKRALSPIVKRGLPSLSGLDSAISEVTSWFARRQTFYMAEGVSRLRY
ncbi:subtilisin-like protein [Rhizodiscina lignyota]|uniref:Subtilisin-like protein n=1 Tax=Rhizodiscina lignyota TaxID=1504668 RepID=A0A9P4MBB2_9PEZI|nr:subtilisin-like protein [Rhizodiscina lignyota]